MRVSPNGEIAQTSHPSSLGSSLTHPYITTDYSEALLEFVTPVFQDPQELLNFLTDLHLFTLKHIGNELLWNNSMPCLLREDRPIPIAYYGTSNIGKMKRVYRTGLFYRYNEAMQAISGVHFNFSLTDECFKNLLTIDGLNSEELQNYKSKRYMSTIRNLHKHSWFLPYVLGASPALCQSFLRKISPNHQLIKLVSRETLSLEGATSLRLSNLGYTNALQERVNISYNSLKNYIDQLHKTTTSPDAQWEQIGIKENGKYKQLNNNILQIENEYYSGVRPKRKPLPGESPLCALNRGGIEYIELRSLDINSFSPIGIDLEQILLLDVFLLYCFFTKDEQLDLEMTRKYRKNQELVACHGRKKGIGLFRPGADIDLVEWAKELFDELLRIAYCLDGHYQYSQVVKKFQKSALEAALLYSAKIEVEMRDKNETFFHNMLNKSEGIAVHLRSLRLAEDRLQHLTSISIKSLQAQKAIEESDQLSFHDFLTQYFKKNSQLMTQ